MPPGGSGSAIRRTPGIPFGGSRTGRATAAKRQIARLCRPPHEGTRAPTLPAAARAGGQGGDRGRDPFAAAAAGEPMRLVIGVGDSAGSHRLLFRPAPVLASGFRVNLGAWGQSIPAEAAVLEGREVGAGIRPARVMLARVGPALVSWINFADGRSVSLWTEPDGSRARRASG
ncbi:MAG: hypothetical protein R3F11_21885 [Verrucomicrobiales bacterium]